MKTMNDPKYERLPHAGDFENKHDTEAFYLSPKPLPTGGAPFTGLQMHQEVNDVYLDFAQGVRGLEFAVRCMAGSVISMMIFFSSFNLFVASYSFYYGRLFWSTLFENVANPFMWGFTFLHISVTGITLFKIIRQITSHPPIRFNRQRREVVYVREKGQPPLIVPWEEVIACVTAGTATGIAKILFVVFLVMFVVSFIFGRRGRG